MSSSKVRPNLIYADDNGNIYDHPQLQMLCRKGPEIVPPKPDELTPLPPESDIFLLPQRKALGYDPENGRIEYLDGNAVAAFVCPGYTLTGVSAYQTEDQACTLPLFAYAALGYAQGKFWVAAQKVDSDKRQQFRNISKTDIQRGVAGWEKKYPGNRLFKHLSKCALKYSCPAAKNLALGRFEAPLPTSRACNARCIGCISWQPEDTDIPVTQQRIDFLPRIQEICQVMHEHATKEKSPIFSFGQGCEGEPLLEASTIAGAIKAFRQDMGRGTININTNGSLAQSIDLLSSSGLNSLRVSLNSARENFYNAYYRPVNYDLQDVIQTIKQAKANRLFISLNYLYFPGISDREDEFQSLSQIIESTHLDFIQLRNLNLDPETYIHLYQDSQDSPAMGLKNLQKRLRKSFPWIGFGYFNPYLGED